MSDTTQDPNLNPDGTPVTPEVTEEVEVKEENDVIEPIPVDEEMPQ